MTLPCARAPQRILAALLTSAALLAMGSHAWAQGQSGSAPGQNKGPRMRDDHDARLAPDARQAPMAAAASGDYRIDALNSGYRWTVATVTYSFYEDSVFAGAYYGSEAGVREVSEGVKANVRAIMAWYGTLLNVSFVEVAETTSTIGYVRFMLSNAPSYAYAYYPSGASGTSLGGDIHLNPSYDFLGSNTNGFQNPPGEHGYVSLVHEIGHAVGLKHPFDGSPTLPTAEDNDGNTVMTYTFKGSNSPATPMAYDLLALQFVYGARSHRTGNDIYAFTGRGPDQYMLGGTTHFTTPFRTRQAIWDSDGYNTLDLSRLPATSGGYRVDMRPGGWISPAAEYYGSYFTTGTAIGPSVAFRDVLTSSSGDTIVANLQPNVFRGYCAMASTGADVLFDAGVDDTIDLSTCGSVSVSQAYSGNDLVLTLGSTGTITVKDYLLGRQPTISYGPLVPRASIGDARVQEGHQGTTSAVFTVALSSPPASAVSLGYVTADQSAAAGQDYVAASGTVSFAAGEVSKTVVVAVLGDTSVESDETFLVTLSSPGGGVELADPQGVGTIVNDDVQVAPARVVSVAGISLVKVAASNGAAARAVVRLTDENGSPYGGAVVTGSWSGLIKGSVTGTTDASGAVTFTSRTTRKRGTATFTVTGVTPAAGDRYEPSRNVVSSASIQLP